eukprot:6495267-Prymnesium_polylepis.1
MHTPRSCGAHKKRLWGACAGPLWCLDGESRVHNAERATRAEQRALCAGGVGACACAFRGSRASGHEGLACRGLAVCTAREGHREYTESARLSRTRRVRGARACVCGGAHRAMATATPTNVETLRESSSS